MNSMLPGPMNLDMQLYQHQRMLFRQHRLALRRRHPADGPTTDERWPLHGLGNGPPLPKDVRVKLQNRDLWRQFHAHDTEMIITKSGRRMFPSIQLTATGLERGATYCILLEVELASPRRRHKYVGGSGPGDEVGCDDGSRKSRGWTTAGPAELQPAISRRVYFHPDGPAIGAHWMERPISFGKLKLTNNAMDHRNNVVLTSMHKYVPRIWIVRCDDPGAIVNGIRSPASSFVFDETEFIAVTAYQNEKITRLKINNNPFAKGFRETGQSRCKRKFQGAVDEDEDCNASSSDSESHRLVSGPLEKAARRSGGGSYDDSGISSCGDVTPPLPALPAEENSKSNGEKEERPRLHRPWMDDSPSSSSSSSSSSVVNYVQNLPLLPSHYQSFHPLFLVQPNFSSLRFYR